MTPKQERFCHEYLKDLNGRQAAIRSGYSLRNAEVQASRLLRKGNVSELVQKLLEQRNTKVEVTAEIILRELLMIATADLSKAYDENGNILPIKQMPEELRRAIAGCESFEVKAEVYNEPMIGFTRKIKLWDKTRALELLGKHLALFVDRIDGEVLHKHSWIEQLPDEQLERAAGKLLAFNGGNGSNGKRIVNSTD